LVDFMSLRIDIAQSRVEETGNAFPGRRLDQF